MRAIRVLTPVLASMLCLGACGGGSGSTGNDHVPTPPPPVAPPVTHPVEPPAWSKPAIVLILADDLGYGSLNSYGAYRELVRTPQIDRLATGGVRFTQAYAPSSVCSPTRYGVLMGHYPWRTQLKVGVVNPLDPLWPSTDRMNLPKWLKANGYTTAPCSACILKTAKWSAMTARINSLACDRPGKRTTATSGVGPYGDFIHDIDGSVGRILDALDEMGIADDTLVIFASDNGGEIPGNRDTTQRLAMRKGLAINGLLRGDKHTIWEGGTRVPLIVRMPGDNQRAGTVSDALVNLTDVFATIVDLVGNGTGLPDGAGPDSVSFLPAVQANAARVKALRTSSVTANVNGIIAIRSGDWKWIEGALPEGFQGKSPTDEVGPQLYNLRNDPEETRDISRQYPDVVERLRQELKVIRASD